MVTINQAFIAEYLESKKAPIQKDKELLHKRLKNHSDGLFDDQFVKNYQPSEPDWALEYKKENFRAITKPYFGKIQFVISKIFRSNDLHLYKGQESTKIIDSKGLFQYLISGLENYQSLKNYWLSYYLKRYMNDPNGVMVVMPDKIEEYEFAGFKDFPEPELQYISIDRIVCIEDDFILYVDSTDAWILIDDTSYYRITRVKKGDAVSYNIVSLYDHNLGYVPVVLNSKVIIDGDNGEYLDSYVSGILPHFDQALLQNMDKLVSIKMHAYPEKAIFIAEDCGTCNGNGKVITPSISAEGQARTGTCPDCSGSGYATMSPFGITKVRPARGNEQPLPDWAPAKYIEKDLSAVEFMSTDIKSLIANGLSAVNMDFLDAVPLVQSGVSKSYDWESANLFLYTVAEDIFGRMMPKIIKCINDLRYGNFLGLDSTELAQQIAVYSIPQNYDIITASSIQDQMISATTAGISPSVKDQMEIAYVNKTFGGNTDVILFETNVIQLDPLRGKTTEEKVGLIATGTISKLDMIISENIARLITLAVSANKGFYDLSYVDKYKIISDLATALYMQPSNPTVPAEPLEDAAA